MPNWTDEQKLAIELNNRNLLISAAAGSGKTAVLTERIVEKASNDIDIDKILVITFTKAAAQEMRERISDKLSKRLDEINFNTLAFQNIYLWQHQMDPGSWLHV